MYFIDSNRRKHWIDLCSFDWIWTNRTIQENGWTRYQLPCHVRLLLNAFIFSSWKVVDFNLVKCLTNTESNTFENEIHLIHSLKLFDRFLLMHLLLKNISNLIYNFHCISLNDFRCTFLPR